VSVVGFTASEIRALATQAELPISDAQITAIVDTIAVYESDDSPCAGLHHLSLGDARMSACAGAVEAEFSYLHRGLPRHLGLEVTVFAVDGTVVHSQDFG